MSIGFKTADRFLNSEALRPEHGEKFLPLYLTLWSSGYEVNHRRYILIHITFFVFMYGNNGHIIASATSTATSSRKSAQNEGDVSEMFSFIVPSVKV